MRRLLAFARRDRGAFVRHLAVVAAALVAYVFADELRATELVLWLLGCAAFLNSASFFAATSRHAGVARLGRRLSPVLGVASWGALIGVTGGAERSPFVAGLWLEVALSALSAPASGILAVAAWGVAALWVQAWFVGAPTLLLPLHTGFLGLVTAVMLLLNRKWRVSHRTMSTAVIEKSRQVSELEERLEDAYTLARVGEQSARLAHGMKNSVHHLRGFTRMMEPVGGELGGEGTGEYRVEAEVLDGLQRAIDQLEELAQRGLAREARLERITGKEACSFVREAANEVVRAFPDVRCHLRLAAPGGDLHISPHEIRDVTKNLVLNSIEAMEGRGELSLTSKGSGPWQLSVTDRGPGLSNEIRRRLFRPGKTSRNSGSGYGLYLCRKLLEARGGRLSASLPAGGGASFSVSLPVIEEVPHGFRSGR